VRCLTGFRSVATLGSVTEKHKNETNERQMRKQTVSDIAIEVLVGSPDRFRERSNLLR
jgi:hypothetical protein